MCHRRCSIATPSLSGTPPHLPSRSTSARQTATAADSNNLLIHHRLGCRWCTSVCLFVSRADLWALGCIIFEMLDGRKPFQAEDDDHLYQKVTSRQFKIPGHFDPNAKDLVDSLLVGCLALHCLCLGKGLLLECTFCLAAIHASLHSGALLNYTFFHYNVVGYKFVFMSSVGSGPRKETWWRTRRLCCSEEPSVFCRCGLGEGEGSKGARDRHVTSLQAG